MKVPPLPPYTNKDGLVLVVSRKITSPVCGKTGLMILKKTSTKTGGKVYKYKKWNVYHHTNRRWCYLNKHHLSIPEIRIIIKATQKIAQNSSVATQSTKSCFSRLFHRNNEFSLEPGMGIEPMCSGSAAHRLNRSATPAIIKLKAPNHNKTFVRLDSEVGSKQMRSEKPCPMSTCLRDASHP